MILKCNLQKGSQNKKKDYIFYPFVPIFGTFELGSQKTTHIISHFKLPIS